MVVVIFMDCFEGFRVSVNSFEMIGIDLCSINMFLSASKHLFTRCSSSLSKWFCLESNRVHIYQTKPRVSNHRYWESRGGGVSRNSGGPVRDIVPIWLENETHGFKWSPNFACLNTPFDTLISNKTPDCLHPKLLTLLVAIHGPPMTKKFHFHISILGSEGVTIPMFHTMGWPVEDWLVHCYMECLIAWLEIWNPAISMWRPIIMAVHVCPLLYT